MITIIVILTKLVITKVVPPPRLLSPVPDYLAASAHTGSRLVFRQGSPLLPADLSSVATSYARSTIIVSDQSRSRDEADAQSLRCVWRHVGDGVCWCYLVGGHTEVELGRV